MLYVILKCRTLSTSGASCSFGRKNQVISMKEKKKERHLQKFKEMPTRCHRAGLTVWQVWLFDFWEFQCKINKKSNALVVHMGGTQSRNGEGETFCFSKHTDPVPHCHQKKNKFIHPCPHIWHLCFSHSDLKAEVQNWYEKVKIQISCSLSLMTPTCPGCITLHNTFCQKPSGFASVLTNRIHSSTAFPMRI